MTRRGARDPAGRGQAGLNQYDLGTFNEATVIETIRQAGAISRTEISLQTGLTQQSVSRILRLLLERGLMIEEGPQRAERLGKPRTPIRMRAEAGHAVGILVDPEVISLVLADLDGHILARAGIPLTPDLSPDALLDVLCDQVVQLRAGYPVDEKSFLGVGLAVPGPKTPDGQLLDLPLKESWSNVPLRQLLEDRLGCQVVIEKDGTAAAIGERWVGRADRAQDFAYIYMGTGVGCGLILNGQVYSGATQNAGEFGQLVSVGIGQVHPDGRPQMVRELNPPVTLHEIAVEHGWQGSTAYPDLCAAAVSGDPAASAALERIANVITAGVVSLVDLLDLELVVIGGPAFLPPIRRFVADVVTRGVNDYPIAHRARTVVVAESLLEAEAAALGAASMIFHMAFAPRAWGARLSR